MNNFKYKVGDRVIASDNIGMYKNETGTIVNVCTTGKCPYRINFDKGYNLYGWVHSLIPVDQKIVITTDGSKTTTATLYENGKKVKTATAKCAPEDTFDFAVGAKLAVERLTAKEEPPKPEYYNGKVVCVNNRINDGEFIVGKVYEIKNGKFLDEMSKVRPCTDDAVRSLSDLSDKTGYFGTWFYKFIPLVED